MRLDGEGRILIATYPARAKTTNSRRHPAVSVVVMSDEFNGPWVQVDGTAEVTDVPDAVDGLVESSLHLGRAPRLGRYRAAMVDQGKSLIAVTPQRWGPIATAGSPRTGLAATGELTATGPTARSARSSGRTTPGRRRRISASSSRRHPWVHPDACGDVGLV